MANIIKGHAKKRLTSMQDIKDAEAMKGKSTEGKGRGKDKKLGKANTSTLPVDLRFYEGFSPNKITQKQKVYNEEIFETVPEMYFTLKMTNRILIRYYSRINKVETNTGIILPEAKLPGDVLYQKRRADGSGQSYADSSKEVTNPFKFMEKAVIVNVPDWAEDRYKVGDVVSVHTPPTDCPIPGLADVYYSDWFVHPNSGELKPPTNLQNPHYGYRLINDSDIRCVIGGEGFDLETEDKTKEDEQK
jgi:hypothetical protein